MAKSKKETKKDLEKKVKSGVAALDKENTQKVIDIIKNLENITVIIITHDKEILSICDKKYLLENKKINEITY